ncbi:Hypothetical predicted protein, partial [Paramuricea clavata]
MRTNPHEEDKREGLLNQLLTLYAPSEDVDPGDCEQEAEDKLLSQLNKEYESEDSVGNKIANSQLAKLVAKMFHSKMADKTLQEKMDRHARPAEYETVKNQHMSTQLPFTDWLFGDDLQKQLKNIGDENKIGAHVLPTHKSSYHGNTGSFNTTQSVTPLIRRQKTSGARGSPKVGEAPGPELLQEEERSALQDQPTVKPTHVNMGEKIVVPSTLRSDYLNQIHQGHPGLEAMKNRVCDIFSGQQCQKDIQTLLSLCSVCNAYRRHQQKEPLKIHEVPRAVQTAKRLLDKCKCDRTDPYVALLNLRNTPHDQVVGSPAQRLQARRLRSKLPTACPLLVPKVIDPRPVNQQLLQKRLQQKRYFDKSAHPLPSLQIGDK